MNIMKPRTLVRDLAAAITAQDRFARNGSDVLYVYRDGVYKPAGEFLVRQRVKHVLLDNDCPEMWSRALATEVLEFIALDVPELPEQPSTELINLRNGLLNVRTRELFAHSPEFQSTIRIPITFDPNASCPAIDKFIGEVFSEDAIPLAWEILGDLLTPDRSVQKTICLLGEGGNGKSMFLDLASRFVGTENVCHLTAAPGGRPLLGCTALWQAGEHLSRPAGRASGELCDVQGHQRVRSNHRGGEIPR